MDHQIALSVIAAGIFFGAMSPGPSFVVVARTALASSRGDGLAAALGMGVGGGVFALAAALGLVAALNAAPALFIALKLAGGSYLLYLAWRMWRGARDATSFDESGESRRPSPRRSFAVGLGAQISNPKTAVVYASIFAVAMPEGASYAFGAASVAIVFAIEFGWYSVVALLFSSRGPRAGYLRSKAIIDRVAAGAMGALGLRIMWDVR